VNLEIPLGTPEAVRRDLRRIEEQLFAAGTFYIPQLPNGLCAAAGQQGPENASGYQHAWLRDNAMVAYSGWRCGELEASFQAINSLEQFLMTQIPRMNALIARPEGKEDVRNRPHVRFEAHTLAELDQPWSHAQNDALADVLWLRLLTATKGDFPLTADEAELLGTLARYFGAIEYWRDRDSGPWEEERRVNSSSIGSVLAALRLLEEYQSSPHARPVAAGDLSLWIAKGDDALLRQLPFESPPQRKTDAALLFLLCPLEVVASPDTRDWIVSLVRARLEGEHGIRRYTGDSYFCQDYDEWLPPSLQTADFSNSIELRNELLRPGCEAQWCLFDPILSAIYGRRFQENPAQGGMFEKQVHYLNRALSQLTPNRQCPELYYLRRGEWIPNSHTPLAWTQANLRLAFFELDRSLDRA
jgi:hypothetical protein